LSSLKDSELLYERGIYPQCTYVFRHALTREVVYDSILTKKKRQLHEVIGNAIEELYKDNLAEHYGVLIEHFSESGNYEKAASYTKLASKKARKTSSFDDAIAYEERRVSFLETLPHNKEAEREIIDARATLGMYYTQINNFVLAHEAVLPIVEQAIRLGNKRRMAQVYTVLGIYAYAVEEDIPKALDLLDKAIHFGSGSKDLITLVMANHYLGHLYADNCEFRKALDHLEKGLTINVAAKVNWGIAVHKGCIARTVHCYHGDMGLALQTGHEALQLAEESNDIYSKGEAHVSLGYGYYGKGLLDEAEDHLIKGNDLTGRLKMIALQALASAGLGDTYFHRCEYSISADFYDRAIQLLERCGQLRSLTVLHKLGLTRSMVMNGEKPSDLDAFYRYVSNNKFKLIDGAMKRRISEILLHMGEPYIEQGGIWIQRAVEADEQNGLPWQLAMDMVRYAELCKRNGDVPLARENLGKAIEHLEECGADGWVKRYEEELASLS
jgi:tetratricopeptide (TPR) repeat protein